MTYFVKCGKGQPFDCLVGQMTVSNPTFPSPFESSGASVAEIGHMNEFWKH